MPMKSLSAFNYLAALVLLLSACKRDVAGTDPATETATALTGTWELSFTSSGMSMPQNHPPGNGHLMSFTDTDVTMYMDGQQRWKDTYTVVPDSNAAAATCSTLPPDQFRQALIYGSSTHKTFIQITGRTLTMMSGCFAADGGVSKYRKLSDATFK